MKIICLTGGIGSGKSTVARLFEAKGVPVYYADDRARRLYTDSTELREKVTALFGNVYRKDGSIDREALASIVFSDRDALQKLNALVHPMVARDFEEWVQRQSAPYVIKEAAVLIESGNYSHCDEIVVVTADEKERLKRVMQRDESGGEEVLKRMRNQMPEEERLRYATIVIENNGPKADLEAMVAELHKKFSGRPG